MVQGLRLETRGSVKWWDIFMKIKRFIVVGIIALGLFANISNPYADNPPSEEEKQHLSEALQNYIKYLPDLVLHVEQPAVEVEGKKYVHSGPDGLGPHFFYATIPYVTGGIRLLLNEGKEKEKVQLQLMMRECLKALADLLQDDENFKKAEYDPEYSLLSNNLHAGLALIPLIEEEGKMSLGILREDGWPKWNNDLRVP